MRSSDVETVSPVPLLVKTQRETMFEPKPAPKARAKRLRPPRAVIVIFRQAPSGSGNSPGGDAERFDRPLSQNASASFHRSKLCPGISLKLTAFAENSTPRAAIRFRIKHIMVLVRLNAIRRRLVQDRSYYSRQIRRDAGVTSVKIHRLPSRNRSAPSRRANQMPIIISATYDVFGVRKNGRFFAPGDCA